MIALRFSSEAPTIILGAGREAARIQRKASRFCSVQVPSLAFNAGP